MRTSVGVSASCIGHVSIPFIDGDERAHDVGFALRVDKCDEWGRGAVGVPNGVIVIVIRLRVVPKRILSGAVYGHNHRVIERGIEHPLLRFGSIGSDFNRLEQLFPLCQQAVMHFLERPVGNVGTGIVLGTLAAQERDADFQLHHRVSLGKTEQGAGFLIRIELGAFVGYLASFPCAALGERLVGFGVKVNRIGASVVPASPDSGIAAHFMVGQDSYFRTYELLGFTCIGHGAFSQEETGIDSQ